MGVLGSWKGDGLWEEERECEEKEKKIEELTSLQSCSQKETECEKIEEKALNNEILDRAKVLK